MFKKSTKINKNKEIQENSKKFKPYVVALCVSTSRLLDFIKTLYMLAQYSEIYYFLLVICRGLSGGDSTDVSRFTDFLDDFKFDEILFIGLGDMLDSTI